MNYFRLTLKAGILTAALLLATGSASAIDSTMYDPITRAHMNRMVDNLMPQSEYVIRQHNIDELNRRSEIEALRRLMEREEMDRAFKDIELNILRNLNK
jgi:hypothetical protein